MSRFFLLCLLATAAVAQDRGALESRLAQTPDDAQAHRALSDLLLAQGEPAAAVPHLRWLADGNPTDADVHRQLAQTLLWTDRPADAALVLAEVVALDPSDVQARVQLAEIITWDGQAGRAVEMLAPVADAHPDDARLHRILAFALLASGDARAPGQLSHALALQPDDPDLLIEVAAIERWSGDWRVARQHLERAQRHALTADQSARAVTLLDGVRARSAPSVTTSATRTADSNGLTRLDAPVRLDVPLSGRWAVALHADRGGIERAAGQRAAAASVLPIAVYLPSMRTQLEVGVGVEATPGPTARLQAHASAQQTWTAGGFALARLTAASGTTRDAATALSQGLRRTSLTAEGYAEVTPALALSATVVGVRYADDNQRIQGAATSRWLPLAVGVRPDGPPLAALGLTAGAVYEDTQTLYPDARPYYTPDNLLTLSSGLAARVATGPVRMEGALGLARQSGGSTALEYGAVVTLERPTETVRLEVRRTGSSAYSADVIGLSLEVRL